MNLEILRQTRKIISIASKPDKEEFSRIAKITGAGMVLMGLTGLAISFIFSIINTKTG